MKPNQAEREFQVLSQRVDDAIESGFKMTLSSLENKLANVIDDYKNSL